MCFKTWPIRRAMTWSPYPSRRAVVVNLFCVSVGCLLVARLDTKRPLSLQVRALGREQERPRLARDLGGVGDEHIVMGAVELDRVSLSHLASELLARRARERL